MNDIFIPASEQLEIMYNEAAATGTTCYDNVRSLMAFQLRMQYGKRCSFDYEEINANDVAEFKQYLESEE